MGGVALNRLERLDSGPCVELAPQEEPRPAEDRRERRPKLVGEGRQELVLDAVGFAQLSRLIVDDVRERGRVLGERALLRLELPRDLADAKRARNGGREVIRVDGLRDEVERAATERLYGEIVIAEAGDEDDRSVRSELVGALEELEPVRSGHADVADDDVVVLACDERGRLLGRRHVSMEEPGKRRRRSSRNASTRMQSSSTMSRRVPTVCALCRFRTRPKVWRGYTSNVR